MNLTNPTPTATSISLFHHHHHIPTYLLVRHRQSKQTPYFSFSSLQHHPKHISSSKTPTGDTFDFQDEFDNHDVEEQEEEKFDDMYVPLLGKMRQWSRNKPRGFGEGKVYDTTLEDKLLLEQLQHTKAAQLATINANPPIPIPKRTEKEAQQALGIRVRLLNLPKKKNIHRDLQAAFKPFSPAITHIIPAVSANHKTRDPVCKGYAFLHFNSRYQANRFVDTFSTQPITFGKVQKQIRCEIVEPSSPVKASVDRGGESPLPVSNAAVAPVTETSVHPCVEDARDDDPVSATDDVEDATGDDNLISTTYDDNNNSYDVDYEAEVELKKQVVVREKGTTKKKKTKKVENAPKLNIPGSANRLKTKEKALLSGVFSKYGGKSGD